MATLKRQQHMKEEHKLADTLCFITQVFAVHQMDQKMDSVLRILKEQFSPKPELRSKPSIRRVTIQKCMGASIDDGP
ncbi:unnamed protein product [Pleuronectes platessa]|uniref:Uncharacterized protein n=1 Tax=Pleuronectes platessa TaxID=8262 RepID=A0A9N7U8D8_PLEPL|nr:unnamed protein product [Pleuronectes platessa]